MGQNIIKRYKYVFIIYIKKITRGNKNFNMKYIEIFLLDYLNKESIDNNTISKIINDINDLKVDEYIGNCKL